MASAEKLPSGRFRGIYRDSSGAKRRVEGTFGRKTDAREAAQEAEVEARRKAATQTGTLSARTTWGDWWKVFFEGRDPNSDTTITERKIADKILLDRWGSIPLNKIEQPAVQQWVDELARTYSANYCRRIFGVFRLSINAAIPRVLTASPCAGVKQPRKPKRPRTYVATDEATKLTDYMAPCYADALEFCLETGVRPGELAGLHASQVDFQRRWLTISNTYVYHQRAIRDRPKDSDVRGVPLSSRALEIIERRLDGRDNRAGCGLWHLDGKPCRSALVFLNSTGGVVGRDLLRKKMRQAAEKADLDGKSGYALRRGYATRLAEAGVDAFQLQRLMGHGDLEETEGYVQESPAANAKVLGALGEPQGLRPVGQRGTGRGTNLDNQGLPDATNGEETNTG